MVVDNACDVRAGAAYAAGMGRTFKISAVFIATFLAGIIGVLFVSTNVGSWYDGLVKPPLTPPALAFGVVWTMLYILSAVACSMTWCRPKQDAHTEGWVRFYFVSLFLNTGWTIFFFGFHNITLAFLDSLVLGFFVVGLTSSAWELDRRISYLMMPYAVWLFFAAYLTAGIWLLN